MSANLDGSHVETLVETGRGDKDRREGGGSPRPETHAAIVSDLSTPA